MSLAHQINAGRPSVLDDEQAVLKIRDLYLQGLKEKEIAEVLDIPIGTWDYWKWKNYQGFADKLLSYKHERMLQKAEANIEVLMESEDERVQADISKFVLETVGKRNYSKKTETDITSGGKPIIQIAPEILQKHEIDTSTESNS